MFETATLSYGPATKRVWTTAMGFTGQALLIACALLAPLVSPQTLGRAFLVTTLVPPGAPPPTTAAGSEGCAALAQCGGHANFQEHAHHPGQCSGACGHHCG